MLVLVDVYFFKNFIMVYISGIGFCYLKYFGSKEIDVRQESFEIQEFEFCLVDIIFIQ